MLLTHQYIGCRVLMLMLYIWNTIVNAAVGELLSRLKEIRQCDFNFHFMLETAPDCDCISFRFLFLSPLIFPSITRENISRFFTYHQQFFVWRFALENCLIALVFRNSFDLVLKTPYITIYLVSSCKIKLVSWHLSHSGMPSGKF